MKEIKLPQLKTNENYRNWIKKVRNGEIKIIGGSHRFLVWNKKYYKHWENMAYDSKTCCHYQLETEEYPSEIKRLLIYCNELKKLMYVVEATKQEGKLRENPDCTCYEEIKNFNRGESRSYVSKKINKFAYKLELAHIFDKGNSLKDLEKYYHQESGNSFKPKQNTGKYMVKVSSYPELVKDIITGKIS